MILCQKNIDELHDIIEGLYKIGYNSGDSKIPVISLLNKKTTRITGLPDYPGLSEDEIFYDDYIGQRMGFLRIWLFTILIETIILFIISKIFRRKTTHISNWRLILVGILASTITIPLLGFVLPLFIRNYNIYTVVGELLATIIELFIIKYGLKVSRGKAILLSVICNLCSYLLGILIF